MQGDTHEILAPTNKMKSIEELNSDEILDQLHEVVEPMRFVDDPMPDKIEKLPKSNKLTTTEIDLVKEKINEIVEVVNAIISELKDHNLCDVVIQSQYESKTE